MSMTKACAHPCRRSRHSGSISSGAYRSWSICSRRLDRTAVLYSTCKLTSHISAGQTKTPPGNRNIILAGITCLDRVLMLRMHICYGSTMLRCTYVLVEFHCLQACCSVVRSKQGGRAFIAHVYSWVFWTCKLAAALCTNKQGGRAP